MLLAWLVAAVACRSRDFYHTCYCLSGLSVAQWGCYFKDGNKPVVHGDIQNLLVREGRRQAPVHTWLAGWRATD